MYLHRAGSAQNRYQRGSRHPPCARFFRFSGWHRQNSAQKKTRRPGGGKQNIWSLSAMELHDSSGNLVLHCTPPPFAPAQPPPRLLPSASAHIQEEGAS